jgi:translation elongation factor EF-Tu-like GTPase
MKTSKVRIGQAGIANHGTTILNAVLTADNLQRVSLFDTDHDACERARGARRAMTLSIERSTVIDISSLLD